MHLAKSLSFIGWLLLAYGGTELNLLNSSTIVFDWIIFNIPSEIGLGILFKSITGADTSFRALDQACGIAVGQSVFPNQISARLSPEVSRDALLFFSELKNVKVSDPQRMVIVDAFVRCLRVLRWILVALTASLAVLKFSTRDFAFVKGERPGNGEKAEIGCSNRESVWGLQTPASGGKEGCRTTWSQKNLFWGRSVWQLCSFAILLLAWLRSAGEMISTRARVRVRTFSILKSHCIPGIFEISKSNKPVAKDFKCRIHEVIFWIAKHDWTQFLSFAGLASARESRWIFYLPVLWNCLRRYPCIGIRLHLKDRESVLESWKFESSSKWISCTEIITYKQSLFPNGSTNRAYSQTFYLSRRPYSITSSTHPPTNSRAAQIFQISKSCSFQPPFFSWSRPWPPTSLFATTPIGCPQH